MTTDVHGPIDYLLVIRKEADGSIVGVDLNDVSAESIGGFTAFAGARSGLLGDDDIAEAGGVMDAGRRPRCWYTRTRGRSHLSPRRVGPTRR